MLDDEAELRLRGPRGKARQCHRARPDRVRRLHPRTQQRRARAQILSRALIRLRSCAKSFSAPRRSMLSGARRHRRPRDADAPGVAVERGIIPAASGSTKIYITGAKAGFARQPCATVSLERLLCGTSRSDGWTGQTAVGIVRGSVNYQGERTMAKPTVPPTATDDERA